MKKRKIKLLVVLSLLASLAVLISATGCTGSGSGSAGLEDYPPVVQKLAGEFDLDPEMVQGALEQVREDTKEDAKERFTENQERRREEMRSRFEEKLEKAVEEGDLTSGQMEEILAKKTEIAQKIEELRDLPPEEREGPVQELRDSVKDWLEENDIDLQYFKEQRQSRDRKSPSRGQKGNGGMYFQGDISGQQFGDCVFST